MRRERAKGRTQEQAAARAGMSVRTLRRYERRGKLPSQFQEPRTYRTRPSPFAEDWPWIASQLERDPALQGTTLFGLLKELHPGRYQAESVAHAASADRGVAGSVRSGPRGDLSPDPRARRSGAVRLHPHEQPGRHAGRRAVPAPGLPPGAGVLERRGHPDLLQRELREPG